MMRRRFKVVLTLAVANGFIFAAYAMRSGGVALGTRVVGQQHFLEWRSVLTPTTPAVWCFNLPYGYLSLLAASVTIGGALVSLSRKHDLVSQVGAALAILVCFAAIPIHLTWQLIVSLRSLAQ